MSAFSNEQPDQDLIYVSYSDEEMMPDVQRLVSADLSEPYSVFVYRYFLNQWPELCICAYTIDPDTKDKGKMIAVIVCKAEKEQDDIFRGYIAMLAVNKDHRKKGLGLKLANMGIDLMVQQGCEEIMLEAEESNVGALTLYERLGFVRDERLGRYYLNGSDAYRLKLWVTPDDQDQGEYENKIGAEMEEKKI